MMARRVIPVMVVGTLAIGGLAYAQIPAHDGTITACYDAKTGAMRVIDPDSGELCKKDEKQIAWNRQGAAGVSGYTMVKADGSSNQPGVAVGSHPATALNTQRTQQATAYCPPGTKVTGGGVDVSFAPGISINASYPQNPWGQTGPSEQDGGWTGFATLDRELDGKPWNIKVWAFCASVT